MESRDAEPVQVTALRDTIRQTFEAGYLAGHHDAVKLVVTTLEGSIPEKPLETEPAKQRAADFIAAIEEVIQRAKYDSATIQSALGREPN